MEGKRIVYLCVAHLLVDVLVVYEVAEDILDVDHLFLDLFQLVRLFQERLASDNGEFCEALHRLCGQIFVKELSYFVVVVICKLPGSRFENLLIKRIFLRPRQQILDVLTDRHRV